MFTGFTPPLNEQGLTHINKAGIVGHGIVCQTLRTVTVYGAERFLLRFSRIYTSTAVRVNQTSVANKRCDIHV